jgi:hypothetical protein
VRNLQLLDEASGLALGVTAAEVVAAEVFVELTVEGRRAARLYL